MDQTFGLTGGDSIVLKLKRGQSYGALEKVRTYLANMGLHVEWLGELGDEDLGLFGTIEVRPVMDARKVLTKLKEIDEVDAAYTKPSASPP